MVMDPLLDTIPESQADCELLKSKIAGNSMASPFFAKEDFSVVTLMLMKDLDVSNKQLISLDRNAAKSFPIVACKAIKRDERFIDDLLVTKLA